MTAAATSRSPSPTPAVGTRPLVKICGVTRAEDACRAVALGADMVGLNFHPPSPRALTPEAAREIVRAIGGRATVVGVFVDLPVAEIAAIDRSVGLDLVQLHGREDPAAAAGFGRRAIQVFRRAAAPAAAELAAFAGAWGFLFDVPPLASAGAEDELPGGTGRSWDWSVLAPVAGRVGAGQRYLVAGGVGPDEARPALELSGAAGIDACSRIESAPGVKDHDAMRRLIEELHDG